MTRRIFTAAEIEWLRVRTDKTAAEIDQAFEAMFGHRPRNDKIKWALAKMRRAERIKAAGAAEPAPPRKLVLKPSDRWEPSAEHDYRLALLDPGGMLFADRAKKGRMAA